MPSAGISIGSSAAAATAKNSSTSAIDKGCWTIGLVNSQFKYMSAETFGFKTNANGKSLKKKQVWLLEPSEDGKSVTLKSYLDKYLSVDQFGNVTCDQVIKTHTERRSSAAPFARQPHHPDILSILQP